MKCLICQNKPDYAPRAYRNSATGEILHGGRVFCSDTCEEAWKHNPSKWVMLPVFVGQWVRVYEQGNQGRELVSG